MQQHLRRSTQAQPEPRRQTWTQRAKALCLAGLMALAGTPLWAQTNEPNEPPILGLTQPWEGANFNAPANVTLAAWAYDADGIQSIAFYDGATLLATDTQAPYEFQWANVPAGSHNITAKATDTRGSVATSTAMSFTVDGSGPNEPPILGLTQPWEGANFNAPANVTLAAWAYDADGIQSIAFYDGATLLATDTQAPYEFQWANAPAGSHNITARATDTRGSVATSTAMSFTVNGSGPNEPPILGLTQPWEGANFNAPANVTLAAWAYDADGIQSIAFYDGATLLATDTQTPYEFQWTNVPAGSHNITARATDTRGSVATSAAMSFTVNGNASNQAPTVSLTAPAAGASFAAPATVNITADAADSDGSVSSVAFYNGATLLGTDTSAPYSYSWTNVAAGSYNITTRATDNQGAVTTSAAVAVTVNAAANAAPTVSLTAPTAGASFTAPATVNITADAADSDGSVSSVAFYNGATLLGTDTSAPYSYSWTNVAAGSYNITTRATDNQGAVTTSAAVAVTVNAPANTAPTVSLTSPATGVQFTAPATVNITADAADTDGAVASVAFYSGATLLNTDTTAPYSFSWANVPAGTYSLTARVTDDDGATTISAAVSVTVSAANQTPTVALTGPTAGTEFTAPASITLTADAADTDGSIASVAFYNGATLLGTDTSAPYSFSWSNVAAGSYSVTAQATDNSGAVTTSTAVSVTVSAPANQAPAVSLTSPAAGANFTAPATVNITADAADSDGSIASVAFYNGATLLGTDTTAPYSFSWTDAPAGTHSLTARATDDDGATTTSAAVSVTVSAANQTPTVALTSPAAGTEFTAPASITLTADAIDSDGSIASVAFYNGATLLGTDTTAPYSFSWSNVAAGSYSITAVATDNQGAMTTSVPLSVTVGGAGASSTVVNLVSPAPGATYAAPASITIAAEVSVASGRTLRDVWFYANDAAWGYFTQPPYQTTRPNVLAGTYNVKAIATDDTGATFESATVTVTVAPDAHPPTVRIQSPGVGAFINGPTDVTLTATAQANPERTLSSVSFYNGATLLGTVTSAPYAVSTGVLQPGIYSITARATDSAGDVTTSAVRYLEVGGEEALPTVAIRYPLAEQQLQTTAGIPIVYEVSKGRFRANNSIEIYSGQTLISTTSYTRSSQYVWRDAPAGRHSLTVVVVDGAGTRVSSQPVDIVVSDQPPVLNMGITTPAQGQAVSRDGDVSAYFYDPASQIASTEFLLTHDGVTTTRTWDVTTNTGYRSAHPSLVALGATTPGAYSLVVRALDAAGNELLRSSARPFVLSSAPFVVVSEPLTGHEYAAPAVINVMGRATTSTEAPAFPGLDRVEVYLGATLVSSNARVGASNDFSATLPDVPVGVHDIRVRAYALDGSHAEEIRRVRVMAADDDDRLRITQPVEGAEILKQVGADGVVFIVGGVAGRWDQLAEVNVRGTGPGGWYFDGAIFPGGQRDWMEVRLTPVGPWSVQATAETQQGGLRYSQKVGFNIYDRSIAIWNPNSFGMVPTPGRPWTMHADAKDCTGCIAGVEFLNGETVLARVNAPPYELNAASLPVGTYSITARMLPVDASRGTLTSAAVSVTVVANAVPTVALTSPAAGAVLGPYQNVTLAATASDADGTVAKVDFYNGEQLLASRTTAPYTYIWPLGAAGEYVLSARATDNQGAVTTSAAVTVNVAVPNQAPTVSLTSPAAGASFTAPANITLTADATDSDGSIASVAFYNGATLLGTDTSAPYSFSWANVPAGSYQIAAVATDNSGATTISVVVGVTVAQDEEPSETITYIHTDVSGSPLAATNANANVVWKENYAAYGERRLVQSTSEGQGQWFHGKQADATTGLQYFGARYYDPAVGRFMGVDPVGFQEDNLHSFNRYAYGNNNPVKYLDPDGNNPIIGFLLLSALFLELDSVASGNPPTPLGPMGPVVGRGLIKGGAAAAGREGAEAVAAKGPIHHICTNKNCVSTASGGPWTPRFEAIFQKAGMKLDDALNKITVPGHKGPHPEAYHQAVFRRLEGATSGLNGKAYRDALQAELGAIGREIQTQGSALNKLLTKP